MYIFQPLLETEQWARADCNLQAKQPMMQLSGCQVPIIGG